MALRNRKLGTIESLHGQILQETDVGAVVDNERVYQGGSGTKYEDISSQTYKTSIERIRASTNLNPNIIYKTMDFGVPGEWQVDESDTTSQDDTGNVLVNASGQRIKKRRNTPANLLEFGCVADGVTNDTVSIQKALDSVGSLFIPHGYVFAASGLVINSPISVFGGGKFKAINSASSLLTINSDNASVDGVSFEGDGTFEPSKGVPNLDRISLIRINGDNVTIRECTLINGHQNFIHVNGADNVTINNNVIIGGITTYDASDDTGYQGIRVTDSNNIIVSNNNIKLGSDGGKTAEAIYCGPMAAEPNNFHISNNTVDGCYDHGVYAIGIKGLCVEGNIITSDSAAIAISSFNNALEKFASAGIVSANIVRGANVGAATPAIFLRDANYVICDGNNISGFNRGIMLRPVQYSSTDNTINGNIISNNTISGWTEGGIVVALAGLQLGAMIGNSITGNKLIADTDNVLANAVGITLSPGTVMGEIISKWNVISDNTIIGGGDIGILLANAEACTVSNNTLSNVCIPAATNKWGISISNTVNCSLYANHIEDTNVTPVTRGGIRGSNDNSGVRIIDNSIVGTDPSFAPVSSISGSNINVRGNTPSRETTFQIRQLWSDSSFISINSDTTFSAPDPIEGKQTNTAITNAAATPVRANFSGIIFYDGRTGFDIPPSATYMLRLRTINGLVYGDIDRSGRVIQNEIAATTINADKDGIFYKDISADTSFVVSGMVDGDERDVSVSNTDVSAHTVSVTGSPFPDGAPNSIPAGGRCLINLKKVNGVIYADIKIYS